MIKKIVLLFLFWRLILFIPLILSKAFIPYRQGYPYTSPLYFLENENSIISHYLLSPWANFDGVYYLLIAANGYTVNAGFFPLLPLLIHVASSIFGSVHAFDIEQYFLSLILVSLFFLISLIIIYKLVRLDFNNNIAMLTILAILVFPTSFFFASIYSESLFLLLSLSSFYFARKRNWLLASITGSLLTATRLVGVAIIPALILEFIKEEKTLLKPKGLLLLFTPLGIAVYMLFNFLKWGDIFYFIQAQGSFLNNRSVTEPILIPQTIYRYIKILTSVSLSHYEWWIALLEISTFMFVAFMLFVAWKKRLRLSYITFALICFFIPTLSGTFTGLPRYVLVLFPIFITLALIKSKLVKISYAITCFVLLFVLFMLFSRGYYIA